MAAAAGARDGDGAGAKRLLGSLGSGDTCARGRGDGADLSALLPGRGVKFEVLVVASLPRSRMSGWDGNELPPSLLFGDANPSSF